MIRLRALLFAGLAVFAVPAMAQDWQPTDSVEVVVHTGPGGGGDLFARALARMIDENDLLPVTMQVSNKSGGNGAVAMSYLNEKRGDPHTLGVFTSTWLVNSIVAEDLHMEFGDLTPIAGMVQEPTLFMVRADSPYATLKDFIEAAKAKPGELKQAAGGMASSIFVTRQILQQHTGAEWAYISFPGGGERVAALLGGHADIVLMEPQEAGEQIRGGTMRALALVGDERLPAYPDVPTLAEAGYEIPILPQIRGVVAPPEMPAEAVAYWQDLFSKVIETDAWKKYVEENQIQTGFLTSGELATFADGYIESAREMFQAAGLETR